MPPALFAFLAFYLLICFMSLRTLLTEQLNPASSGIDYPPTMTYLTIINREDAKVVRP